MTENTSADSAETVAYIIENRFSEGMGTVKDLGIQIVCEDSRLKHMLLPYRDDLCLEVGKGMPANLAATLLDTAFGLDVMLYVGLMQYTATIDFTTAVINKPKENCGLLATCDVMGTNGASIIMRGEVREIETGHLVLSGQGNFLYNQRTVRAD